ncbi:MAG TPA: hypothetical protein VN030_08285 [Cellvibrio sp.]|nr:hypothetical protein [Cellvibrio sp.]
MSLSRNICAKVIAGAVFLGVVIVGMLTYSTEPEIPAANALRETTELIVLPERAESIEQPESKDGAAELNFSTMDTTKPVIIDGQSYAILSPSEISRLHGWLGERGYFDQQDTEVYNTYTDNVLQELGKKGDLVALHILTNRAVKAADEKSAKFYMHLAIINGSTVELDGLTIYTRPRIGNEATEAQRRPSALETLAVSEVIALRGDKSLSSVSRRSFVNSYKTLYGVDLVLAPEEQAYVAARAQEIYNHYQELRHTNGLGDFDNSEPSGVKKFFGLR